MTLLREAVLIGHLCLGIIIGYVVCGIERNHNACHDSTGKYTHYTAWLSERNGVYRCFWLEDSYPYRVKQQGVVDVR
jgi:formylmethanofuran dehydrogenase subunit E-like metal-binding protein